MKLSIPANWEDEFFEQIDFTHVKEVYGKLAGDFVGGGRASVIFNDIPMSVFKEHVKRIRAKNISFNYLLNATCLDNLEFTKKGQKKIFKLLELITNAGTDTVTVALPQLIPMIKNNFPDLKISVSTNNMVDNLERVRYWEEFGVDNITLSYTDINRNFNELKRIVKYKKCDVQLLCNLVCIRHCPFQAQHANFHSHASQTEHVNDRFPVDYFCMHCIARIFSNPYEIIRAAWIRPEDIQVYENIGIERFKLAERGLNTKDLSLIVNSYSQRSYDGNFLDLIPGMSKYKYITDPKPLHFAKYFAQLGKVNLTVAKKSVESLIQMKKFKDFYTNFGVIVDNKKLDGFIEHFTKTPCNTTVCEECNYCDTWSEKAITILNKDDDRKIALKHIQDILHTITSFSTYNA